MTGENDRGFGKTTAAQMLRKRAEAKVAADNKIFKEMSATEMSNLIYELRIHQVELEMQNEELRKSQAGTDRSRKAYQDLWELSPVGYDYDELIGIFGTDVIAADFKELVKRHMLSGYERPYEAIAQKKDGTKFHVEIRGKMRLPAMRLKYGRFGCNFNS